MGILLFLVKNEDLTPVTLFIIGSFFFIGPPKLNFMYLKIIKYRRLDYNFPDNLFKLLGF